MSTVLRPKDVAQRWQCSEAHVRNLHRKGVLEGFHAGNRMLRFTLEAILRVERGGRSLEPMTAFDRWKASRGQGHTQGTA